jgi:hypothetical protein
MKTWSRILTVAAAMAMAAGLIAASVGLEAAPTDPASKQVQMSCRPGWRGGGGGQYGGVSFSLACNSDKTTVVIEGTSGTSYSVRMGAENLAGAVDCFFSGDARNVNETCGEVRLTIR